ncbi:inosine/xanthosine triphosphatase [Thermasporomyces composti]|uniref:Probable inosine/xanthosine triphosphatase n=1 Tax=Thermasporomyces composti TaxID=696763 RepID=A0A3D9V2K3_THECX|nr:inosine/xanthosine triphosphatase [Thermasporomyces composti]REF34943.1 inosine/xanthosine triphosphatase [Thermasporomyces composti]
MPFQVVIASTNPVKRRATLEAVRVTLGHDDVDAITVDVNPGVPAQPVGDEETLRGARNRAEAARLAHPNADLWVGIEGGVLERNGGLECFAWIVVLGHGEQPGHLRKGESRTATFVLPTPIADLVRAGVELGEATDRVLGCSGSKQRTGTVGPLTGGVIDRVAYYAHAAVLALVPFRNAHLPFPEAPSVGTPPVSGSPS